MQLKIRSEPLSFKPENLRPAHSAAASSSSDEEWSDSSEDDESEGDDEEGDLPANDKGFAEMLQPMAEAVLLEHRGIDIDTFRNRQIQTLLEMFVPMSPEETPKGEPYLDLATVSGVGPFKMSHKSLQIQADCWMSGRAAVDARVLKDMLVMRMFCLELAFMNNGGKEDTARKYLVICDAAKRISADPRLGKMHAQFLTQVSDEASDEGPRYGERLRRRGRRRG